VPDPTDQDYITTNTSANWFPENFYLRLAPGCLPSSLDESKERIDGVILAGTELPLILRDPDHNGFDSQHDRSTLKLPWLRCCRERRLTPHS